MVWVVGPHCEAETQRQSIGLKKLSSPKLRLIKFVKQRVVGSCDSLSRTHNFGEKIFTSILLRRTAAVWQDGDGFLMEIYKTVKNRFSREFSHDNRGVGAQVER